ncbi:SRPBCC family protein [Hoeflea prorocentri]|uniref:SRPBCC family protein n=1 Tax=Hoeflea prorocentri TaxID=1922333 RepID=A0A9X3ZGV9_9HYPH|nr:SRPBCC family protein [Hoeflea prorocentri]MCY6380639.1 SRPBCC family protein [Hoeflea prorocentri]MDA5398439.1 SRPBCC family protein [Hoeflea prorocentri]
MKTEPFFIAAAPVAVFSALSDIEGRSLILSSVSRVDVISTLPVQTGTIFKEKRRGAMTARQWTVTTLRPPHLISFRRRQLGMSLSLEYKLTEGRGGTVITATVTTWTFAPFKAFALLATGAWSRQCERDLADIKRYVEQRANPAWRPGL